MVGLLNPHPHVRHPHQPRNRNRGSWSPRVTSTQKQACFWHFDTTPTFQKKPCKRNRRALSQSVQHDVQRKYFHEVEPLPFPFPAACYGLATSNQQQHTSNTLLQRATKSLLLWRVKHEKHISVSFKCKQYSIASAQSEWNKELESSTGSTGPVECGFAHLQVLGWRYQT